VEQRLNAYVRAVHRQKALALCNIQRRMLGDRHLYLREISNLKLRFFFKQQDNACKLHATHG